MLEIGVLQAKTDFSAIIAEVERTGEAVTVTRHGKAAVKIVRADPEPRLDVEARKALVAEIIRTRDEIASRHPDEEPFDIREALDRDRSDRWS